jgi:hypothetical protein
MGSEDKVKLNLRWILWYSEFYLILIFFPLMLSLLLRLLLS